jgi:hypothetical protein
MNMNLSELINEILSEWAYRVDDGMPNPKNPTHLKELGIVLSEMGLSHIEGPLVENLLMEKGKTPETNVIEADGNFTNPALNKSIKYKNDKGEDAEGIVGNLLRLPKEHPGRVAAEKTLPADGTPERDKLNKDLGGQGQPAGAEKPKADKGGEEGGAPKEDPAKAAQAMFDPKADPAMAARMNKEKDVQAQLAKDAEADKEAEKAQEPKEDGEFAPIDSKDVAKEMPQADPDTFSGGSDIPDGVTPEELNKFNTDISKVAQQVADAKAKGEPAPNINLCDVTVPGTNLYCDDNLGIPRDEMPQFKGTAQPGSRAASMDVDASGEVDTEPVFKEMLKEKGIKTLQTEIPADKLKATQKDLVGAKVVGMMGALEKDPNHPKITAPIYVSRDGHVIDGHHRWAAVVAYNAANPDKQIPMKTTVLDMDIKDAIPMANKFAEDMGIAAKKADANKETPSEPQKVTSVPKITLPIQKKIENWTKEEKAFFERNEGAPGSKTRRSIGQALRDKAAGAWKAIKKGAKHEVHIFKDATKGVSNFFAGNDVSEEEVKALKSVGVKILTTAVFAAGMGGLAAGAAGFAKLVAIELVPHVVAETVILGAGRAALFADVNGESEDDANMIKFTELIAKGIEEMEITPEMMEQMVDSYNEKKESGEIDNVETPIEPNVKAEHLHLADALMLEMIYGFIEEATGDPKLSARSKETGKIVYFKTKQAKDTAIKGGTHEDPNSKKSSSKKEPVKGASMFKGDAEYQKRLSKEKPKAEPTASKPTKGARIIGGKDKTLEKVDTLKSKEFTQKQQPDDVKFAEKNKKFQIGPPPNPYKLPKELLAGSKVPPRHLKALERMMNTKATTETAKWSHFSDLPGGAGQISAQAGELMTMIGTTLDDKQAELFYNSLLEHEKQQIASNPKLKVEGSRVVGTSWIKAAMNNRKAIRNRLAKEYPGATIEAGSWDTQGEVEAMGLKDYKKNKGFSTDAYFKIKTKDGQQILDEVSLKKSTAVNFLNSGTGKLFEWDANIPDNINPNIYQKNQRKSLLEFGSKNIKKLETLVSGNSEFEAIVKAKKIDLPSALAKLQAGKGSRDVNKVVLSAITIAAKSGNKDALKYLQNVQDTHKAHQKAVITALGSNPKLKQGMLAAIREEFPLKAVGEGEESMAIGPNSLDRAVLKNIFETSDFEQIKQGLFAVTNEEPPYLAYKAGKGGKVIPIASIVAREDGVGYGGQIKFEMQLDKRFAKILEQANKNVYGG